MDDALLTHHRRLSFSTSSERDQPFVRDRSQAIPIPVPSVRASPAFASERPSVSNTSAAMSVRGRRCNYRDRDVSSMQNLETFSTIRQRADTPSPTFSISALPPSDPLMSSPGVSISAALPISALLCPTGCEPTEPSPSTPPQRPATGFHHRKSPSLAMLLNPTPSTVADLVPGHVEHKPSRSPTLPVSLFSQLGHESDDASLASHHFSLVNTMPYSDAEVCLKPNVPDFDSETSHKLDPSAHRFTLDAGGVAPRPAIGSSVITSFVASIFAFPEAAIASSHR